MLDGFKKFILRGNVVDMATGIIIGAAFSAIVASFVKDIITPPMGMLLGGVDFKDLFVVIKEGSVAAPYATLEAAQNAGAVTINYGMFINSLISFVILAAVVYFVILKVVHMFDKIEEEEEAKPAEPSSEEKLLAEIRDLLKK